MQWGYYFSAEKTDGNYCHAQEAEMWADQALNKQQKKSFNEQSLKGKHKPIVLDYRRVED